MAVPSPGRLEIREWRARPTGEVRAPPPMARRMSLLYREVWRRLRSKAGRTLLLSCLEGRVKALIWRRSSSGMFHHGVLRVMVCVPTAISAGGVGGKCVYMTQYGGRGATAPSETLIFVSSGRSSNWRTALLAFASASSLPITFVWARAFFGVVRSPLCSLSMMRRTISSIRT